MESALAWYKDAVLKLDVLTTEQLDFIEGVWMDAKFRHIHLKGAAGTGKTFVALHCCLDHLKSKKEEPSKCLFVAPSLSLSFHFGSWLVARVNDNSAAREDILGRITFLVPRESNYKAFEIAMAMNSDHDLIEKETEINDYSLFGLVIVDEAQAVFCKGVSQLPKPLLRSLKKKNEQQKLLLLSDTSQAQSVEADIKFPSSVDKDFELKVVSRSSENIIAASLPYQLGKKSNCTHGVSGPRVKVDLFHAEKYKSISDAYASKVNNVIDEIKSLVGGEDLNKLVAIIVPDEDFGKSLVNSNIFKNEKFEPVTAEEAMKRKGSNSKHGKPLIVIDTSPNLKGLEFSFVVLVALDRSIKGSDVKLIKDVQSGIYRSISRGHLAAFIINHIIKGGWFEWLRSVTSTPKNHESDPSSSDNVGASNFNRTREKVDRDPLERLLRKKDGTRWHATIAEVIRRLKKKCLCADSILIIYLGISIALHGICHIASQFQLGHSPRVASYLLIFFHFSTLSWVVFKECKELEYSSERFLPTRTPHIYTLRPKLRYDAFDNSACDENILNDRNLDPIFVPTNDLLGNDIPEGVHPWKPISEMSKDELDILGVSVHHLQHFFMKEVHNAGLSEDSKVFELENLSKLDKNGMIRQKGANVFCPIDGKKGAAYVHSIKFNEEDNEDEEDHFGLAQFMLSYTWGYTIGNIISTLLDYCALLRLNPKRTYVWVDAFCINQHRVVEKKRRGESVPFIEFQNIFEKKLRAIGHLLPMMSPWYDPEYLIRVWTLFDFIMARRLGCKITIIMPGRERDDFLKMIDDKNMSFAEIMTRLFDIFSNVRVQDAKASEESDRVNIMQIIESSPGGYDAVNAEVNELMREWAIGIMKDEIVVRRETVAVGNKSKEDFASFLCSVGLVLDNIGKKRDALAMLQEALSIHESLYGREHVNTAGTMNNMARVMDGLGQKEKALKIFQDVLSIHESKLGKKHTSTADTLNNMAYVMDSLGQKEEALAIFQETLSIYESLLGKNHASTANTMNNMARVMDSLGKKEEALQLLREAFSIHVSLYGRKHASTADTMNNMARVLDSLGKKEEALAILREAFSIQEALYGKNHASTASTMNNMARVMDNLGQKEEALQLFQEALSIFESTLGTDHPTTVDARRNFTNLSTSASE